VNVMTAVVILPAFIKMAVSVPNDVLMALSPMMLLMFAKPDRTLRVAVSDPPLLLGFPASTSNYLFR
jgi:hypothetical protein